MLNMLPKLELVPIRMYFMMLPKCAGLRARRRAAREVVLEQDDIGGLLRDVDRAVDRDADVGGVQRGRVVDAVAQVPTTWPRA